MAYATQQDMEDRFGERELVDLTDRDLPLTGAIVAGVVTKAIADAEAEIQAYISARYPLPLPTSAPPILVRLTCDIARYYLYFYTQTIPDAVQKAYVNSVTLLKRISEGKAELAVTPPAVAPTEPSGISTSASTRIFTEDELDDY
jgi:phage gp36-like protein